MEFESSKTVFNFRGVSSECVRSENVFLAGGNEGSDRGDKIRSSGLQERLHSGHNRTDARGTQENWNVELDRRGEFYKDLRRSLHADRRNNTK